ncbi:MULTISPECIES: ABC transporter permease [Paracoccus]|jgi:phospholipid/cholesterol/gamma-HCH transport system permease protein|uniref:MlaE family lipid ABC transporter permease subunit n=1 Tax=Paracoccus litorisediminis TaxID=2006130 RepID=A0A844HK62_9RHOB|nr:MULTISPECIES: ABC transporter permease [Paracoccus]MBD9526135.1 ABC transporter permease [Paracoccus sp. PAR01]MTH58585.1 MlaE family lipid ABC transporter permease subunit [Paracoccus litorisediminis]
MNDLSKDHHLTISAEGEALRLAGEFTVWTLPQLPESAASARHIDLSGLTRFDTAAAWYLAQRRASGAVLAGMTPGQDKLLESVIAASPGPDTATAADPFWHRLLEGIGQRVTRALIFLREIAEYLGRFLAALARAIRHPADFRLTSFVHHCQETGLRAVPIVALMSFLIGVVLAFQGAVQLQQFGAEVFVVDLIAISILRELGILLTAIIVAGRTASALTASIGSMKMREEIDAMRTLGMDPDMVLILPRVLALVVTLPILGLIADVAGLVGGGLMTWYELGISPAMFRYRLITETDVDHVIVGMLKAPVFAVVIGIIGCHAGMKVGKDAESLGAQTSTAVVNAIFAVIVLDALFSIFFAEVGL